MRSYFLAALFLFSGSVFALPTLETLFASTNGHACRLTNFKDRGYTPTSYDKGMVLTFAKSVCQPGRSDLLVATGPLGPSSLDALAHYGIKDTSLASVYGFLFGFAMRESSGLWCMGLDSMSREAKTGTAGPETTEGGLFQTSYNSRNASKELPKLFAKYKGSKAGCFSAEFQKGITCKASDMKNWGTGEGRLFQELSKSCPAFATEYAAVMLRVKKEHYGPLVRREVQYLPACVDMFKGVEAYIKANPSVCNSLRE